MSNILICDLMSIDEIESLDQFDQVFTFGGVSECTATVTCKVNGPCEIVRIDCR
jgi:hypothetical protein